MTAKIKLSHRQNRRQTAKAAWRQRNRKARINQRYRGGISGSENIEKKRRHHEKIGISAAYGGRKAASRNQRKWQKTAWRKAHHDGWRWHQRGENHHRISVAWRINNQRQSWRRRNNHGGMAGKAAKRQASAAKAKRIKRINGGGISA